MAQTSDELIDESLVFYANKQTDIYFPIRNSQRVKYTSFHVCREYIAFGSSSGGVYLFKKCQNESYDYLFTLLNADNCGPITCLAFAVNDDHLIAMATSRGHLMIAEIEPEKQFLYTSSWNILYQCNTFTKSPINILKWDPYYDSRLYISDESGQVFILHNVKDMKNLMVLPVPSIILKINGKIFQLEICIDLLLLSTQHKYILYDLSSGELTQIGKKSVRSDGHYGVCFFPKYITANDNHIYNCIFCSRPKSRLWECDLKGSVQFTHQFKELLINQMPQKIINGSNICFLTQCTDITTNGNVNYVPTTQTPTFAKLCVMNIERLDTSLIVTFSNSPNTCLYIINPINACIVSYCILNVSHIQDMYCIDSDIYLIYNMSEDKRLRFSRISLLTLEQCLQLLTEVNNDLRSAANFVINHFHYFSSIAAQNRTKTQLRIDKILENIWSTLKSDEKERFKQIEQLIIKRNDEKLLIDKTQELFLNSIDSNASDLYNRHSDVLYYDLNSQYNNDSTLEVMDIGFTELKKLKDIVLSKLNSNQIDYKTNSLEPLLSAEDSDRKQLTNSECLEENNRNNLIVNKTEDNKRNDLKLILDSLENELNLSQSVNKYKCVCDSPLPGSHLNQCQTQEKIQRFLNENIDFMEYSVIDLIEISKRNAIWPLYIQLMHKCQEYEKYLKLCLMLNDVKLLLNENIQNYLFSAENFEKLLILFAEQRDVGNDQIVRCIECNKSLTNIQNSIKWETIIRLCIQILGVEEAIVLLKRFADKNPLFSIEFYLSLLRMRMISVYQSPVTREKLNKLMIHLNSFSKVKSNPSLGSLSSINSSTIQNQSKGFKINICIEKCAKCKTNLMTKQSDKCYEKLIVFYCKHIYHKSCLTQTQIYCILCDGKV